MSEGMHSLRNVEIFAAGNPRGKTYTTADLDDMVNNFRQSSIGPRAALRVPAVLGHDESQEFLERSNLPAAAWAERVYRDGNLLKCDFADVPPKVAQLLKSKAYRKVSAEVYDEPPSGVVGKGKMLRRVAFLGGEIPQVKNLDDIPLPEPHGESGEQYSRIRFSDSRQAADTPGLFQCFSEVTKMADDTAVTTSEEEKEDKEYDGDHSAKSPEEVEKMRERARFGLKKYADRCRKMGESDEALQTYLAGTPMPEKKKDEPTTEEAAKFSEAALTRLVDAAVGAVVKRVESKIAGSEKRIDDFEANTRRASVEKFCETMVQAGKIIPAQLEKVQARLLRADAREKVHKFSENGKDGARTELEEQMAEIERGPVLLRFGERQVRTGNVDADDGKAAVEANYESFAETYQAMGTTKEELTKAFEAARKETPRLTAEQFLKPAAAAV